MLRKKKISLKQRFADVEPIQRAYDAYEEKLRELDTATARSVSSLESLSKVAVDAVAKQRKEGAVPALVDEADSTVHHINVARQALGKLPRSVDCGRSK